jgi:hypothetical protein
MQGVNSARLVTGLFAVMSLVAAGCGAYAEEADEGALGVQTEAFKQALDESGLTPIHGAKVAVTGTHFNILTVFTVKDANGKTQIAGQGFGPDGKVWGTNIPEQGIHPVLTAYSSGDHAKSSPGAAFDIDGSPQFLVVWQDEYSSTDNDIWGAFATDDAKIFTPAFHINFDGDDEKSPSVIKVRENGSKWLVTYTRKHGSTTSLSGNWVHTDGTVEPLVDIVPSGIDAGATPPSASYAAQFGGHILFTWNNNKLAFGDPFTLGLGTTLSIANATGITSASNSNNGLLAATWRQGNSIMVNTFPGGCGLLICATPTVTALTSSGGIQNPVIAANNLGFGVFAGTLPASNKSIATRIITATGTLGATKSAVNPVCGNAVVSGGALGFPGTIAAATFPDTPTARQYVIYAGYCDKSPLDAKIQGVGITSDPNNVVQFNATN